MAVRINWMIVVVLVGRICASGECTDIQRGYVSGRTYVNAFFGLFFTPPPTFSLEVDASGTHCPMNTLILVKAVDKKPGDITPVFIVAAERLAKSPDAQVTARAYLSKVVQDQKE